MRGLVVETDVGAADDAIARLEAAGHEVARCHDRGERHPFPCAGLSAPGACPLDGSGVDVALSVRARPMPTPAALEDGGVCALRARVPLVVTGQTVWNPFVRLPGATVAHGDVVAACETVATSPVERDGEIAREALRSSLARLGVGDAARAVADAVVTRSRAGLHIRIDAPPGLGKGVVALATTRVVAAVRGIDPLAPSIDVSVRTVADR